MWPAVAQPSTVRVRKMLHRRGLRLLLHPHPPPLSSAADRLARLQEELAMAEHRSERIKWLHFAMAAATQRLARLLEEEFAMDAEPSSSVVKVECKTEPSS